MSSPNIERPDYFLFGTILLLQLSSTVWVSNGENVKLFYFIYAKDWNGDEHIDSTVPCDPGIHCECKTYESIGAIRNDLTTFPSSDISVGLYHIHSWKIKANKSTNHLPPSPQLSFNLTMAVSAESSLRFGKLFTNFQYYDGYMTTNPRASVRFYYREYKLPSESFEPKKPHSSYVRGATYVASTCHRHNDRDRLVRALNQHYRIDSLGKCFRTPPRNDTVRMNETGTGSISAKVKALSNYLFYLALENSVEDGYVTEKVFDGLSAGTNTGYVKTLLSYINLVFRRRTDLLWTLRQL